MRSVRSVTATEWVMRASPCAKYSRQCSICQICQMGNGVALSRLTHYTGGHEDRMMATRMISESSHLGGECNERCEKSARLERHPGAAPTRAERPSRCQRAHAQALRLEFTQSPSPSAAKAP